MATLQDLRNRRHSIQCMQKVMSAMKVVAGTKFRQLEKQWGTLQEKTKSLEKLIYSVRDRVTTEDLPPYLKPYTSNESTAELWIVIGADRGLCGGYNGALFREFMSSFRHHSAHKKIYLALVGKRLQRLNQIIDKSDIVFETALGTHPSPELAQSLMNKVHQAFQHKKVAECRVLSTHFQTVLKQQPRLESLTETLKKMLEHPSHDETDALIEPSPGAVFSTLLDTWLYFHLFYLLIQSAVSEQGARMAAMEGATRSSQDLIKELDLTYNRTRQAIITRQLIEVVSGANAL